MSRGKLKIGKNAANTLRRRYVIKKPARFIAFVGLSVVLLTSLFIPQTTWRQIGGAINMQNARGTYGVLKETETNATFKEEEAIKYYLQYYFPQIDGSKYAENNGWFKAAVLVEEMTDGAIKVDTNSGPEKTRKYYIERDQAKIDEYNKKNPDFKELTPLTLDISNIKPEEHNIFKS
ncbi:MAG: hypothetical protein WDA21_00590 [Bacilli bacterium]